jgi:putative acyl-CoA dehydrogenase
MTDDTPTSALHDAGAADTHQPFNLSCELLDHNTYLGDVALREAVRREGAADEEPSLVQFGQLAGSAEQIERGVLANRHTPELDTHDRFGRRVDLVRFHPAYHELMRSSIEHGLHSSPWRNPKPGAHVARAARMYLQSQAEAGHMCPITMTYAAVPALRSTPSLAAWWEPLITANRYDPRNLPHTQKQGLTIGMAMTEKQGGSDVRANTTQARPMDTQGAYALTGHKYFVSAPMCDAFLVLAQTPAGLGCFLVPRWLPDGSKNPLQIIRLKRKMGNASNASSETELRGALGWLVGEEGRGVRTIIDMVAMTRFDCMLGSSAGQRAAVAQALHHCAQRSAFGKRLIEQPLMRNVLAGAGARGVTGLDDACGQGHRPARDTIRRPPGAPAHRRGQILDLQAHPSARRRGHGVHRRKRRDGRQPHAQAVQRVTRECDLGRQRQCPVPGRLARPAANARRTRRPDCRARAVRRGRPAS